MNSERQRRIPINFGKLTDAQIAFLEATPWHLKAWHDDGKRLRVVYPELKQVSRWFSSEWDVIAWDFIKPSGEMQEAPR